MAERGSMNPRNRPASDQKLTRDWDIGSLDLTVTSDTEIPSCVLHPRIQPKGILCVQGLPGPD